MNDSVIDSLEGLREIYPEPTGRAVEKQLSALDEQCRKFIAHSPFLVLGTLGDVSPKGDAPGFVRVIDDNTILIPDRRGNNRLDSMKNLLDNPAVGIIFFVPGVNETLRVNGTATITSDGSLLEPLGVNGKVPKTGLLVHVEEAYLHCAKALVRSKLWDAGAHVGEDFPRGGRLFAPHVGADPDQLAGEYDEDIQKTLY